MCNEVWYELEMMKPGTKIRYADVVPRIVMTLGEDDVADIERARWCVPRGAKGVVLEAFPRTSNGRYDVGGYKVEIEGFMGQRTSDMCVKTTSLTNKINLA
jgi:hypothetical protein